MRSEIPWCSIVMCDNHSTYHLQNASGSESENCRIDNHFCIRVLHDTINHTNVRYIDILILVPTFLYFIFLSWCLLQQWKTIAKRPLCTVLFSFVYMITISGLICKAISMTLSYESHAYKVFALLLRGFILVSEIGVVTFGLAFKLYRRSRVILLLTVLLILVIGIAFTTTEGVLEFKKLHELPCAQYNFFTHGGMIFLFCTSAVFCLTYLSTFLVYLCRLHKKWNLPSRATFYYYALVLSVVNAVQAVGSMLWYKGLKEQNIGQSGICMVTLTTIIYETTYVPMTYWIFLRNFLRSKSNDTSTNIDLKDQNPVLPTDGLLSKAHRFFTKSGSPGHYGTSPKLWSANDDDDSEEDESGLYSSGGSNFVIRNNST